ncbi:MAG TPA: hypothetical protein VGD66_01440 [Allosphingosinicella sp.]|jgi:hypothetical protein
MSSTPDSPERPAFHFDPVRVRHRHDGWTAEKQITFIEALAECACVTEAAKRVGRSPEGAYALRRRMDGMSFRLAWDAALDYGVRRLSDAAFSRALHGVAVPHYYKGERVGEHRRYNEQLTMFLLRYRDPLRYSRSRDRADWTGHQEGPAFELFEKLERLTEVACLQELGMPPPPPVGRPTRPSRGPGTDVPPDGS